MLTVDASPFYDLPESGRLLWMDPVRLAREATLRRIPAARTAQGWALPQNWVDAEAGLTPADAPALRDYWLTRLAPPSIAARKTLRPLARLGVVRLLSAAETRARLFCDQPRLERLHADGTLPALRVDGALAYDAELVEALEAEQDAGPLGGAGAAARRAEVLRWAQAEYASGTGPLAPSPRPVTEGQGLSRAAGFETRDE